MKLALLSQPIRGQAQALALSTLIQLLYLTNNGNNVAFSTVGDPQTAYNEYVAVAYFTTPYVQPTLGQVQALVLSMLIPLPYLLALAMV
jgi:hypothetical protein